MIFCSINRCLILPILFLIIGRFTYEKFKFTTITHISKQHLTEKMHRLSSRTNEEPAIYQVYNRLTWVWNVFLTPTCRHHAILAFFIFRLLVLKLVQRITVFLKTGCIPKQCSETAVSFRYSVSYWNCINILIGIINIIRELYIWNILSETWRINT